MYTTAAMEKNLECNIMAYLFKGMPIVCAVCIQVLLVTLFISLSLYEAYVLTWLSHICT